MISDHGGDDPRRLRGGRRRDPRGARRDQEPADPGADPLRPSPSGGRPGSSSWITWSRRGSSKMGKPADSHRDADAFFASLTRIILETGVDVETVMPADESVHAVYDYLIGEQEVKREWRDVPGRLWRRQAMAIAGTRSARRHLRPTGLPVCCWLACPCGGRAPRRCSCPRRSGQTSPTHTADFAQSSTSSSCDSSCFSACALLFVKLFRGEILERSLHYRCWRRCAARCWSSASTSVALASVLDPAAERHGRPPT